MAKGGHLHEHSAHDATDDERHGGRVGSCQFAAGNERRHASYMGGGPDGGAAHKAAFGAKACQREKQRDCCLHES